jgi:hypothetical protein
MSLDFTNDQESGLLAAGKYTVTVANATVNTSKAGNEYLKIEFDVDAGGKIWENFVLNNKVGRGKLKSFLLKSGGPLALKDVNDLCGLTCVANIGIQKDETYGDKNQIKSFLSKGEKSESKASNPFG